MTVAIGDRNPLERKVKKTRTRLGLGHPLNYVRCKIKVLFIFRAIVKPHNRFENRRASVARPVSGLPKFTSPFPLRTYRGNDVIAQLATRLKRHLPFSLFPLPYSLFPIIVMEKTQHRILHSPYVPSVSASILFRIIADITRRLLSRNNPLNTAIYGLLQLFRFGICQIRHSRMHILTPKFSLPPTAAFGLFKEGRSDVIDIS
jgi:hypothetical protein